MIYYINFYLYDVPPVFYQEIALWHHGIRSLAATTLAHNYIFFVFLCYNYI